MQIVIAGRDKTALTALRNLIESPEFEISIRHINNGHADPLYGLADLPNLLIFHLDESNEAELACLVDRPAELRPEILVIGPEGNSRFMRMAMKAGACDYLEDPVDSAELIEALENIRKSFRQQQQVIHTGRLIAVVSAKGGAGASFLALNLAHMMAAASQLRVALIDLDLQFGALGQYLDLDTEHGLLRALDMADHLDAVAVDAYMAKHASGVSLLGPLQDEMVLTGDIPIDRFSKLLDLLKTNYDRTIVDQPRQIDDVSAAVYQNADRVLIVMQQDLANVRDATRLRKILLRELAVPEDHITVVVNRYDKSGPVELGDICRSLGVEKKDVVLVPNHYRNVAESMNVGIPMLDHARGSAVTKALIALEAQLGGRTEAAKENILSRTFSNILRG